MSKNRSLVKQVRVLALAALASVAVAATPAGAETLKEKYQREGVKVGLAGYAPYGYKLIDGTYTGEQVEVVKHVLGKMGIDKI